MTQEMKQILDEEIETAIESGDENRLRRVMARYIMAIGDCQYKTSNRVKSVKDTVEDVQTDIGHIKEEIKPMKESHLKYQAELQQRKGAKWAIRIVWGVATTLAAAVAFIVGRAW